MNIDNCEMAGLLDQYGYEELKWRGVCKEWTDVFDEKGLRKELAKLEKAIDYTIPGHYRLSADDWCFAHGLISSHYPPDKSKGIEFLYKLGFISGYLATTRGRVKQPPINQGNTGKRGKA